MILIDYKRIKDLQSKQKEILLFASKIDERRISTKIDPQLSPISWHLIHCTYIEVLWLRSIYLHDNYYKDKLEKIADSSLVPENKRGKNLPKLEELLLFAKKIFSENIRIIKETACSKKKEGQLKLSYLLDFLNQHHAQHIETMKVIKNMLNIKFSKSFHKNAFEITPKDYKFSGEEVKEGKYLIGAGKKEFSYDNEKPRNIIYLKDFLISKKIITVAEWFTFILDNGYNRKEFWSSKGWHWKTKKRIAHPISWKFSNKKKFAISTPEGYIKPDSKMPVTNISKHELEAFAKCNKLRLPHEYEWEVAAKKISDKFKVWEWAENKFFGYKGFKAFPYKEYSYPWFDKDYYTLKGSSLYTLKEIRRYSFRNFYKPDTQYIFSGGRLCL